ARSYLRPRICPSRTGWSELRRASCVVACGLRRDCTPLLGRVDSPLNQRTSLVQHRRLGAWTMTLTIPPEIEQKLAKRAVQRNMSVEALLRAALDWYLQMDPAPIDEPTPWPAIRQQGVELGGGRHR